MLQPGSGSSCGDAMAWDGGMLRGVSMILNYEILPLIIKVLSRAFKAVPRQNSSQERFVRFTTSVSKRDKRSS